MCPRSFSVGLITLRRNSLVFTESVSECGGSSCSEEWNTLEALSRSSTEESFQPPSKSSANDRKVLMDDGATASSPSPTAVKSLAYSIERWVVKL
ncbi:hypothetical protein KIN20_016019 [Parelaphostrongylus tenuis]|uniref:Uncharacterized protein n=1 Tax=Parelaphostrongylus tenuis TaxID=148309 RepID=A0AAD5MZB3_PARTN|nr:hypothetical protein KIN20_016019 [Parelaphostrongylus tenuis]